MREAGNSVCCGGILGMGESETDRVSLLHTLATLPQHPQSVPINQLVQVPGTPLHGLPELDPLDLVRAIATARLLTTPNPGRSHDEQLFERLGIVREQAAAVAG